MTYYLRYKLRKTVKYSGFYSRLRKVHGTILPKSDDAYGHKYGFDWLLLGTAGIIFEELFLKESLASNLGNDAKTDRRNPHRTALDFSKVVHFTETPVETCRNLNA